MFYKEGYAHKAISVTMLVTLLLVHSVKLLHAHNGYFSNVCKGNSSDNIYHGHSSSSDCSICNYQLGKDADDNIGNIEIIADVGYNVFNEQLDYSFQNNLISFFESRGPPFCLGLS